MSAGITYKINPGVEQEERYDVQTGIRRRGSFILDVTNLPEGTRLPAFAPVMADLKNRKCRIVMNVKLAEAYTNAADALAVKVAKGSIVYPGMFLGDGKHGAKVASVDRSNANYDTVAIEAAFGADIAKGAVLFEAKTVGGTTQKAVANSALYANWTVAGGINNVTLLRTAAEIEPDKLVIPFSAGDKEALRGWFQFNE